MIALAPEHPLLVFGGPYSNLQATEAMIATASELGVPASHVICTGDVVAYAGDPEATVARIRDSGFRVIAGNCEEQLAEDADDCGCGFDPGSVCDRLSKSWYEFARRQVSEDAREWMRQLPATLSFTYGGLSFRVVHGGVSETSRFIFGSQTESIEAEHGAAGADVVIAGHCGIPFIAAPSGGLWINPGVIGVPANDGTTDGWYGRIALARAPGSLSVTTHRLSYDFAQAAANMRRHGYADRYADAIETGLWPSLDVLPEAERSATGRRLEEISQTLQIALSSRKTRPEAGPGNEIELAAAVRT